MKNIRENLCSRSYAILFLLCIFYLYPAKSQNYYRGLEFLSDNDYHNIPLVSPNMIKNSLPSNKDLSAWFPIAGFQGSQGSCAAWAIGYGLKSYQEAVERKNKPDQNSEFFSPSFLYNQTKLSNCASGANIPAMLNFLKSTGIVRLTDFGYDDQNCTNMPNSNLITLASAYRIADWRRVNFRSEIDMKCQIACGFPIIIGILPNSNFDNVKNETIFADGTGTTGHAMVIVGYDDTKQAYKVLNSYSTNWGVNGYCWISYNFFQSAQAREAYVCQDIIINDPTISIPVTSDTTNIPTNINVPSVSSSASLNTPFIQQNIFVQTPSGTSPGLSVSISGDIKNYVGAHAQCIIRFYDKSTGKLLFANPMDYFYRDYAGNVAIGSLNITIMNNPSGHVPIAFYIPYYSFNFPFTNNTYQHVLIAKATFYINNFETAISPPVEFSFLY